MPVSYANLTAFVAALAKLVPDMKGGYTEADFVTDAVSRFSEEIPAELTIDVGDGSTTEWALGSDTFATFLPGFSESWPITVERLSSANAAQNPPVPWGDAVRIDRRSLAGVPTLYLVFPTAPPAAGKARVHFRSTWTVSATVDLPAVFHTAIVKKAGALKCAALAIYYAQTIDPNGGSDIFDARQYVESYAKRAEELEAEVAKTIRGAGDAPGMSRGRASTGIARVYAPWGS